MIMKMTGMRMAIRWTAVENDRWKRMVEDMRSEDDYNVGDEDLILMITNSGQG